MRVLHVLTRMPGSGTERQLAGMLRAAHRRHWDATLLVLEGGHALATEVAEAGVPVLPSPSRRGELGRLLGLRTAVHDSRADVVHSSLWGSNVRTRVAAPGAAIVCSERRVEEERSRAARLLDAGLRGRADAWIGNSDDVADFIVRAHGVARERVTVIRNGIDASVFSPLPRPAVVGQPARIGSVGRLIRQKGFDVLIEAFRRVQEVRRAHLVIVGEGEERRELEAAAKGLDVELPGFAGRAEDVAGFLRGLDLFVLSSRFEGLPNSLLEAMSCGVRTVATDVHGVREATGGAISPVHPDDPSALAEAILVALDGPVPAYPPPRSFADVAVEHRLVFERALARRL